MLISYAGRWMTSVKSWCIGHDRVRLHCSSMQEHTETSRHWFCPSCACHHYIAFPIMFPDLVWCIIYDHVVTETALCLMCLNMILAIHLLSVTNKQQQQKHYRHISPDLKRRRSRMEVHSRPKTEDVGHRRHYYRPAMHVLFPIPGLP